MVCDNQHEHEEFGLRKGTGGRWNFDTAKEAEYPRELCNKVAAAVVELATSKGIFMADKSLPTVPSKVPSSSSSSVEALSSAASLRAASGRQPRGTKFPEMVPEFSETVMRTFDQTVWHEMNLAPGD